MTQLYREVRVWEVGYEGSRAEPQELPVLEQPTALAAVVAHDDRSHLVEQQLGGHVAQHHHQRVPSAPRQPKFAKFARP